MNFCKDCSNHTTKSTNRAGLVAWFYGLFDRSDYCRVTFEADLVDGTKRYFRCEHARTFGRCGQDGELFVAKTPSAKKSVFDDHPVF